MPVIKHCPVCGMAQFATPEGTSCQNGHNGVPSAEDISVDEAAEILARNGEVFIQGKQMSIRKNGCKHRRIDTPDGYDYDCDYPHAGEFGCEDCIFGACNGDMDPRTGRKESK